MSVDSVIELKSKLTTISRSELPSKNCTNHQRKGHLKCNHSRLKQELAIFKQRVGTFCKDWCLHSVPKIPGEEKKEEKEEEEACEIDLQRAVSPNRLFLYFFLLRFTAKKTSTKWTESLMDSTDAVRSSAGVFRCPSAATIDSVGRPFSRLSSWKKKSCFHPVCHWMLFVTVLPHLHISSPLLLLHLFGSSWEIVLPRGSLIECRSFQTNPWLNRATVRSDWSLSITWFRLNKLNDRRFVWRDYSIYRVWYSINESAVNQPITIDWSVPSSSNINDPAVGLPFKFQFPNNWIDSANYRQHLSNADMELESGSDSTRSTGA